LGRRIVIFRLDLLDRIVGVRALRDPRVKPEDDDRGEPEAAMTGGRMAT
jgi:hypothetical protein